VSWLYDMLGVGGGRILEGVAAMAFAD